MMWVERGEGCQPNNPGKISGEHCITVVYFAKIEDPVIGILFLIFYDPVIVQLSCFGWYLAEAT